MRWINRLIIASALLLMTYNWLIPAISHFFQPTLSNQQSSEEARATSFYPLYDNKWITFGIANQARNFRFYFHAALLKNPESDLDSDSFNRQTSYQITYQWLNANGDVLDTKQYNINTRISPLITVHSASLDNTLKKTVPLRFYGHKRSYPSLDQSLYLAPSVQPLATKLQFRVSAKDENIQLIGIRPYLQYHRNPEDIGIAWQRMNKLQREKLSEASVYPSFLISELERNNVMSKYWKPIGPIGVLDKDYRIETIYLRENKTPILPSQVIVANGIYASPKHWVTVRLLPALFNRESSIQNSKPKKNDAANTEKQKYRIQWQPYTQNNQTVLPKYMQLSWQAIKSKDSSHWQAPLTDGIWEGKLANGLLKIVPNAAGILKIQHWDQERWQDITPKPQRARAYICRPGAPLYFNLEPSNQTQSIKVNAKGYIRKDDTALVAGNRLHIDILNSANKSIGKETVVLPNKHNNYQHFSDAAQHDSHILETVSRYIHTTQYSKRMRISCTYNSLVNVSTRPFRHPINRYLPKDNNFWFSYETREPAWFTLEPENKEMLITNKQYFSLLWYFKPIEINQQIENGQYSWQALYALGNNSIEKLIFSPLSKKKSARLESRNTFFQNIAGKKKVLFSGTAEQKELRPSAVYIRKFNKPISIEVWIDDSLSLATTIAGNNGRVRLPVIPSGSHNIEFKPAGIDWFINNTFSNQSSHLIRSAYPLNFNKTETYDANIPKSETLTHSISFKVDITNQSQILAFSLFTPKKMKNVFCKITLKSNKFSGTQKHHSFRDYNYHISTNEYPYSQVLQQKNKVMYGPIPLSLSLKDDLIKQSAIAVLSCNAADIMASGGVISDDTSSFYDFRERTDDY